MSEYPKVYGHCDAGCKRRVVPYEEYLSSATFIVENTDSDGAFVLEQGKTYKISNSNDTNAWGFRISVAPMMKKGSYTSTPISWDMPLPAYDKYDNYIKFRWLELILELVSGTTYNIKLVCEMNGVRQTVEYSQNPVALTGYDISTLATKVRVYNATNCWMFNEDAEIVGGGNGNGTGEGTPGKDGISPTVEVTEIEGGHKVSVTDKNGTQDFEVMDGEDGKGISYIQVDGNGNLIIYYSDNSSNNLGKVVGKDGEDGADGVSPTISVSDITGGHRITIVDKNGTKTIDVMNGSDGDDGDKGDAGRGITSIARTSGNGSAGTTDTYTITYTDNTTSTFTVCNGKNGSNGTSVTITDTLETVDDSERGVLFSDGNELWIRNGATPSEVIAAMSKETWTLTLEDGSTVTKVVPLV